MNKINKIIKKGFTLVELVVVIAVIAILAAVSVGAYFGVTDSASNSKLNTEGAQIKLNISILGSEGNDYCNINKDYLEINDINKFNDELNNDTGINYNIVVNGTGSIRYVDNPIINFIGINDSDTRFNYFEYSSTEVVDKYIKVHIISGDSEIIKGDIEIDNSNVPPIAPPPSVEEDIITDSYSGNDEGITFKLGEDLKGNTSDKGVLISEATYTITSEELNTDYYDIQLYNIKNLWRDAHSVGNGSLLLGKPVNNETDNGSFTFTVKPEVKAVILSVASYNLNHDVELDINGTLLEAKNNTNTERKIKITTNNSKEITISTTTQNKYCYIRELILVL